MAVAGIFLWQNFERSTPLKREVVEFQLQEQVPHSQLQRRGGKPDQQNPGLVRQRRGTRKPPSLADLIPKYDYTKTREIDLSHAKLSDESAPGETASLRREGPIGDPNYDAHGSEGAFGYMESMGLEQATESMPFYQALWGKVDEWMGFPKEIAFMRIGGRVVIHLKVNAQGQMVGDFLRVAADHPVLKTYALVILNQALKTPLHPRRQRPAGSPDVPIVMTFDFRVVTVEGLTPRSGDYFKNSLLFGRTYYIEPYLNEALNYVLTTYVPPIIPIPGGFYVDFVRAYQMIDNYANDRPDLYEQRDRQYQNLRDRLDLTLFRGEAEKAKEHPEARLERKDLEP